ALTLQHSVDEGLHALSGLPELISRIATYAPRVGARQLSPDGAAALAPFAAIYTMDREREVHAELVGSLPPAAMPAAQLGEQTLDDIFFCHRIRGGLQVRMRIRGTSEATAAVYSAIPP